MDNLPKRLSFVTTPAEEEVEIDGKIYLIREASAEAGKKWRNAQTSAARMADGKVVGLSGIADADPLLVSHCLYEVYDAGGGKTKERLVLLSKILSWPDRIQKTLAEWVKDHSNLRELEGNSQADPTLTMPSASPVSLD